MGREVGGDFRYATPRELIPFCEVLKQLDKLQLMSACVHENRFDDRGLVPSRKQNLGAAGDRRALPSRFRQETNRLDDRRASPALAGDAAPSMDRQMRHDACGEGIGAAFDQERLISDRRGESCDMLEDSSYQLAHRVEHWVRLESKFEPLVEAFPLPITTQVINDRPAATRGGSQIDRIHDSHSQATPLQPNHCYEFAEAFLCELRRSSLV